MRCLCSVRFRARAKNLGTILFQAAAQPLFYRSDYSFSASETLEVYFKGVILYGHQFLVPQSLCLDCANSAGSIELLATASQVQLQEHANRPSGQGFRAGASSCYATTLIRQRSESRLRRVGLRLLKGPAQATLPSTQVSLHRKRSLAPAQCTLVRHSLLERISCYRQCRNLFLWCWSLLGSRFVGMLLTSVGRLVRCGNLNRVARKKWVFNILPPQQSSPHF